MTRKKIIAFVQNEGFNLNSMTTSLKLIVSCDILGLVDSFQGTYFGLAFSKACQYALIDEFFWKGF
jgi:hypothetical protein